MIIDTKNTKIMPYIIYIFKNNKSKLNKSYTFQIKTAKLFGQISKYKYLTCLFILIHQYNNFYHFLKISEVNFNYDNC